MPENPLRVEFESPVKPSDKFEVAHVNCLVGYLWYIGNGAIIFPVTEGY